MYNSGLTSKKSKWESSSLEQTFSIGREIAKELGNGDILCFKGHLGAGKTTLIKGIISELTGAPLDEIVSPTFVYCNSFEGDLAVHHFDLYRLKDSAAFSKMGFQDYLGDGICCIEWPERIEDLLHSYHLISITSTSETTRRIAYERL